MILILFDIDGTLVYTTNRQDSKAFAATYEAIYHRPFPTIDWHQYPHVTDTTIIQTVIWEAFKRHPTQEEIEQFQRLYLKKLLQERQQNPAHFKEVPGARKMMEYLLSQSQFCVGIATGGWIKPARVKLGHVEIPKGHSPISGADGLATREEIIEQALHYAHKHHKRFARIVYIGDALWDVQTTRKIKMNFIGIRRKNDLAVLQKAGAGTVLPNFLDQARFLDTILTARPPV